MGQTNALNLRLTGPLDPQERGRLFEQWLVLEVAGLLDYRGEETRLFYWRTHMGAEVDLLVEKHSRLRLAAEVKAKARVAGADCSGLRSFADAQPDVPRVAASLAPREFRIDGILVLPFRRFLERLGDGL